MNQRSGLAPAKALVLDDLNRAIVAELQKDGRKPYASIAATVGLSEASVRQRVAKLIEQGAMQIVAVTDPMLHGFQRQAMVGVRVSGDSRAVADCIAALDEVEYVVLTAGTFDVLVELVCIDDEHLLTVLNDTIRSVPGVIATETFVYLKLVKQTYTWGTS